MKSRKLAKPKVFFSTAESLMELIETLATVDQNATQGEAEEWLQRCARDHKKNGSPPSYWNGIRIFRVTVEEVERKR